MAAFSNGVGAGLATVAAITVCAAPSLAQGFTTRASFGVGTAQGNGDSYRASISADGRFVAFVSSANNLQVTPDTNGFPDIFVRDRLTSVTRRVTVSTTGGFTNAESDEPSISGDGRFVAFLSRASNLVVPDTNPIDVYVRDLQTNTTQRVDVSSAGVQGNGACYTPHISGNGRFVIFTTHANNLAPNDTTNTLDVFRRDLVNGVTELVSVALGGTGGNGDSLTCDMSSDGRFVVFFSAATDLVASDPNGAVDDVFVRDMLLGVTTLESVPTGGGPASDHSSNASISDDGRYVAFASLAMNFVSGDTNLAYDCFLRDRVLGTTVRVSQSSAGVGGNAYSAWSRISADGRWIAFESDADNLDPADVNGKRDVFVHDRVSGETRLASVSNSGASGEESSSMPSISGDGRWIAFDSLSSNLAGDDNNARDDVFVRDRLTPSPATYCTAKINSLGCLPAITANGTPSGTSAAPFDIGARLVLNHRSGLLFYGHATFDGTFDGGRLCVDPPLRRTPLQNSGGNASPDDCSGSYAFDFKALIQSGADATLVPGAFVCCQYWTRDAATISHTGLTDAVAFTIEP